MFERLRGAFSALKESISKRNLTPEELDRILWELELHLLESDVAEQVARQLSSQVRDVLTSMKVGRTEDPEPLVRARLSEAIHGVFVDLGKIDIVRAAEEKRKIREPLVVVFLGINGTGKTTTIAKVAKMLQGHGLSVVMACADTHRAGAIEQLSEHAQRLAVKVVSQGYGADPAAVARDAVYYAKNHKTDVVLVDTAGRIQTDRNLMEEVSKIIRVVRPDLKILVVDALAGNDAVSQANEFLRFTDFDAAILTKVDADAKGGAALSVAHATRRPITYLGVGQDYVDLVPFDPDAFVKTVLP